MPLFEASEMADVGSQGRRKGSRWPLVFLIVLVAIPVALAVVLYRLDSFEAAALPIHEFSGPTTTAAARNGHTLRGAERVGEGALLAPEDLAYDSKSGVIYTGCDDGWVKRVRLSDSVVENWVNTGGRPLGIVLDHNNDQVLVADTEKGLLSISREEGVVKLLTEEAEGVKFMLTDGVDVAEDGIIYFTDASHKYSLDDFMWDILEANPNGRLLSYDPRTNLTKVLLHDLYFANGVSLSPDQTCLIFCETLMRRCRKYHIKGERKGSVEPFIDFLPGMPDNIRYDGEGLYWIGLSTEATQSWDLALRYPFIRKLVALLEKYNWRPKMEKNGGALGVDLEGKLVSHYHDPGLSLISSGLKIGNHLYLGSIAYPYIIRLNLLKYPAQPPTTTTTT
ncbi:protein STRICTOSIDINE SYNTHASE-LIKE 4-like [Humulus lupulus]|uniref:protein STRICTOSIDINE SYNTHASE-LIKE 4-like n=1 Tax=Humulus lupulus TaxID=3486 RepID=UPI002B40AA31|nr:protein STRICTOSIDINE SYNTHASE-LIKE 4-like [Humulus lupulus]